MPPVNKRRRVVDDDDDDDNELNSAADACEEEVKRALHIMRGRATGRIAPVKPRALDEQEDTLLGILTDSTVRGKSNSVLILGARGTGKSIICDRALSRLVKCTLKKAQFVSIYSGGTRRGEY
eukprot:m.244620 g.244620  ORF g.244620 m.244620 type:complete len:123 (+) comp16105_c0_seq24:133-501(+)